MIMLWHASHAVLTHANFFIGAKHARLIKNMQIGIKCG